MFIDMHAHTGEISLCCRVDRYTVLETAKQNGFDGIVITNHYTHLYFSEDTHKEWVEKYIEEWNLCRKAGKDIGIKVFCGVEVTLEKDPKVHLLIYGADESFLRENLFLCNKTLEELYSLCKANGYMLIQAHPFRNGSYAMNADFLDGLEINCHPLYKNSYAEEIIKIAKEKELSVTVGCDYHADTYRAKGGMFLPDNIDTDKELADYIKKNPYNKIQLHEPSNGSILQITI